MSPGSFLLAVVEGTRTYSLWPHSAQYCYFCRYSRYLPRTSQYYRVVPHWRFAKSSDIPFSLSREAETVLYPGKIPPHFPPMYVKEWHTEVPGLRPETLGIRGFLN
jgi:hypothetical protein